jgi:hypothetical protein
MVKNDVLSLARSEGGDVEDEKQQQQQGGAQRRKRKECCDSNGCEQQHCHCHSVRIGALLESDGHRLSQSNQHTLDVALRGILGGPINSYVFRGFGREGPPTSEPPEAAVSR